MAKQLKMRWLYHARGRGIRAKSIGQYNYLRAIDSHDLTFAIGPAGTGKTYLVAVKAVIAL